MPVRAAFASYVQLRLCMHGPRVHRMAISLHVGAGNAASVGCSCVQRLKTVNSQKDICNPICSYKVIRYQLVASKWLVQIGAG